MRLEIEQNVASVPFSNDLHSENDSSTPKIDLERLLKQGVSAAQSGERGLARTLLFRVTEADPRNADAWLWLASISEYPEELLGFLDNVLDIDPDNFRARQWKTATRSLLAKTFVQRGVSANEEGQSDFALNCFEKAIEYDATCEAAWLWKASLAASESDRVNFLEHVLELNPDNEDAAAALDEISKGHVQTKMNDARSAAVNGDLAGSEKLLDEILENNPDSVEAWTLRSQVAQPFEEKMLAYRRVFELDPSNVFAHGGYEFLADLIDAVNEVSIPTPDAETVNSDEVMDLGSEPTPEAASDSMYHAASDQSDNVADIAPSTSEYYSNAIDPVEPQFEEVSEVHFYEEEPAEPFATNVASDTFVQINEPLEPDHTSFQDTDVAAEQEPTDQMELLPLSSDENYNAEFSDEERFATDENETAPVSMVESVDDEAIVNEYPWNYTKVSEEAASTQAVLNDDAGDDPIYFEAISDPADEPVSAKTAIQDAPLALGCPFCGVVNESHAFECSTCHAVLSLSDIDSLLNNNRAVMDFIDQAVTQMEADWNLREFNEHELTMLGIGHLNLKNNERGMAYLQEATRLNPNNVILAGQVNAIAIRLDETRRQTEMFEAMPKGKSILVVDDSATVRKLISSKLEKSGHNVVSAVDGVEAMEMIETMTPDLVLLDIAMPRMDGYSVCKLIRSNDKTKDVPVVMISGKDGFFDKVRGRMAGTTGYITKPFGPETLMRALETYLLPDQVSAD